MSSGSPTVLTYMASLARKRMGAGALFRDAAGRVLLVEPTYKPTWEIPGGVVEVNEPPTAACHREVIEELALDRPVGRVLAIDWVPPRPERTEGLMLVYDGGALTPDDIKDIRLSAEELASYTFAEPDRIPELTGALLGRRIAACLDVAATGTAISLEDGHPVA